MKSSSGQYFQALDHMRALAAFTVFAWHFMHFNQGQLAPPLMFPLSFFTEGHTGVALFMTLSGYLFAKLLDGRDIAFLPFLWNRFLRLAPLLAFVMLLVGLQRWHAGTLDLQGYVRDELLAGFVYPVWPNGGWSIAVELHFYLLLPGLLLIARRWPWGLPALLLLPLAVRCGYFLLHGEVQSLAYWTIFGRADQFILGMACYQHREKLRGKGLLVAAAFMAFLVFWYRFDQAGGFYTNPSYPSPSPVWLVLTLFEGIAYALLIAWYDMAFTGSDAWWARFAAQVGAYSYSLYLLHFFFVFDMPAWIDRHLFDLSNPYLLLAMALPCFLALVPLSWLTFRCIEAPFLRHRVRYIRQAMIQTTVDENPEPAAPVPDGGPRPAAVVVGYHPDLAVLDALLAALLDQADPVILIDNGASADYLSARPSLRARVVYHAMEGNQGLGAALNSGFAIAMARGCRHVATFDQDSEPPRDMLPRLARAHDDLVRRGVRCAAVGPCFHDRREDPPRVYPLFREQRGHIRVLDPDAAGGAPLQVDTLITSGMLVAVDAWRAGLAYDPWLFVDYTDTDWCFRARAAGWSLWAHPAVRMGHALSDTPPVRILGINLLRYSPIRRYYYFRNTVRFVRRSYVSRAWRRRLLAGLAVRLLVNPWIDAHGWASLRMAVRGLRDGLTCSGGAAASPAGPRAGSD